MSDEVEVPMLPEGCGYRGFEFGARYSDSECFGGQLYDLDNCDDSGNLYEPGEYIPCPDCRMEEWFERIAEHVSSSVGGGDADSLGDWKGACRFALKLNRGKALSLLGGRFNSVTYLAHDEVADDLIDKTWTFNEDELNPKKPPRRKKS